MSSLGQEVRRGAMTPDLRESLADLLDTIDTCLRHDIAMPTPVVAVFALANVRYLATQLDGGDQ